MGKSKFVGLVAALCVFGMGSSEARALVLLSIDVSNPAAVTVTGTGNLPASTITGSGTFPIQLKLFFTASPGTLTATAASTTLQTSSAHNLVQLLGGRSIPTLTTMILRLNATTPEAFSTGSAAFTGSATFNLSSVSSFLPSNGTTGDIQVASSADGSGGPVIGTFSVTPVPEPSSFAAVGGLGCLALAVWRKRHSDADGNV